MNRSLPLRRYAATLITIVLGGLLSAAAFYTVARLDEETWRAEFDRAAISRAYAVQVNLGSQVEAVRSIAAFAGTAGGMSADGFRSFVAPVLARNRGVQAFEWIPRLPEADRAALEQASRKRFPGYQVRERTPAGQWIPAAARAEYFPVALVEPVSGNERALGFDLASSPPRRAALDKARDQGEAAASRRIELVQRGNGEYGILLLAPVYRQGEPRREIGERRRSLVGYALGVIHLGDVIEAALSEFSQRTDRSDTDPDLYFFDRAAADDEQRVHIHSARSRSEPAPALTLAEALGGRHWARTITVADQEWDVVARPVRQPGFIVSWLSQVALMAFLLFTAVIAAFVHSATRRRENIESLVAERTRELTQSEARTQAVVNTVLDGIITINSRGIIETFNPAAEAIFRYTGAELIGQNVKMLMPEPYHSEHDGYLESYLRSGVKRVIGIGREVTGRRKDGSTFPMDLAVNEFRLKADRMFVGTVRDISDRKRAELLLLQREERTRATLETVPDGIITITERGSIETFNPAAAKIFGYASAEVIGKNVKMLMPEPYHIEHDGYLRSYLDTGVKKVIGRRRDGSTFPLEIAVGEFHVNKARMFAAVVRDLTEPAHGDPMKHDSLSTPDPEPRPPVTPIQESPGLRTPLHQLGSQFPTILWTLSKTRFFRNVSPELLESVLRDGYLVQMHAGEVLLREGSTEIDSIYIVLSGTFDVMSRGKYIFSVAEVGEAIGEVAPFSKAPRMADVIVASDATLVEISSQRLFGLRQEQPERYAQFLELIALYMAEKLRLTTNKLRVYDELVLDSEQQRKRAQGLDQVVQERLRQIVLFSQVIRSGRDGIVIADPQGDVLSANPAAQALFGWEMTETEHLSLSTLFPSLNEKLSALRSRAVPGLNEEIELIQPDGGTVLVELTASPVVMQDQLIACAIFIHDIRRHRELLTSLEQSRNQLASYSKGLEEIVAERTSELRQSNVELTLINQKLSLETENKDHALRRLKETQLHLLQSEKMAALGQLAAGVAHEINNPISFVHSNLGTIQEYFVHIQRLLELYAELEKAPELSPSAVQELVRRIEDSKQKADFGWLCPVRS
jgi:PAS domain S-box-containing protein